MGGHGRGRHRCWYFGLGGVVEEARSGDGGTWVRQDWRCIAGGHERVVLMLLELLLVVVLQVVVEMRMMIAQTLVARRMLRSEICKWSRWPLGGVVAVVIGADVTVTVTVGEITSARRAGPSL